MSKPTNVFGDIQKLATELAKDPVASKLLQDQFRQFQTQLGSNEGGEQDPNQVLGDLYTKLKEQFEHINSPSDLGDNDD